MTPSQRRIQTLLERLPPTPQERILVLRSDSDVIALVVELLVAAAYWFNATAVEDFGGRLGPARDRGLVEQVVAAAFQTYGSVDPHPSPFAKAAMLFRGITLGGKAIPSPTGISAPGFLSPRISSTCWDGRSRRFSTAVPQKISPSPYRPARCGISTTSPSRWRACGRPVWLPSENPQLMGRMLYGDY